MTNTIPFAFRMCRSVKILGVWDVWKAAAASLASLPWVCECSEQNWGAGKWPSPVWLCCFRDCCWSWCNFWLWYECVIRLWIVDSAARWHDGVHVEPGRGHWRWRERGCDGQVVYHERAASDHWRPASAASNGRSVSLQSLVVFLSVTLCRGHSPPYTQVRCSICCYMFRLQIVTIFKELQCVSWKWWNLFTYRSQELLLTLCRNCNTNEA
jgi:hypothetical protein